MPALLTRTSSRPKAAIGFRHARFDLAFVGHIHFDPDRLL